MEELILYAEDGGAVGTLRWKREGLYVELEALTERRFEGIIRAYLRCESGERLLGVMEPFGGGMRCRRRFAEMQLRPLGRWQSGILRFSSGETGWMSYAGEITGEWSRRLTAEGILTKPEGALRLVALPYGMGEAFPLTELFCLAEIREIRGRRYVVYAFSGEGTPTLRTPR